MIIKRKVESNTNYGKVYCTKQEEFIHLYPEIEDKTTWYLFGIPVFTNTIKQKVTGKDNSGSNKVTGFNK